jgi:alkanesulfonate monooxygenase SsuD/methylene tetrahydromethanopterin reductase-like flavin-dependent oxidoreductase (luciferase family)
MNVVTAIAPNSDAAWESLSPGMRAHPERRVVGTPDDIVRQLRAFSEAGIAEVGLAFPAWSEQELEMVVRDVMPAFAP